MKKAGIRRHHAERLRDKRKEYLEFTGNPFRGNEKVIAIEAETPTRCSCPMCGNPRRHFGEVTKQEKIADEKMEHQIEEYFSVDGYPYYFHLYPYWEYEDIDGLGCDFNLLMIDQEIMEEFCGETIWRGTNE